MGGICGWLPPAGGGGDRRAGERIQGIMTRSLAHRGPVAWLEPAPAGGITAAAGPGRPPVGEILSRWRAAGGDTAAFAASLEGTGPVALHDGGRGLLVLVRDRLGERPLAWTATAAGTAFASEMKALRAAGMDGGGLRPEALDAYLAFTYIPAPWTIHREIHKVAAGHVVALTVPGQGAEPAEDRRYWRPPARDGLRATPAEALERLASAAGRRVPPGRPPAAFLSGGLDSSVVVALLVRTGHRGMPTFSAGFPEADLDELGHARRVASLLGTDHREVRVSEITEDLARRVIHQLDEPMADAASLPTWLLAEAAAAAGSRVVMTGDGADAILAGDHWFRRLRRMDRMAALPPLGRKAVGTLAGWAGGRRGGRTRDLVRLAALPPCHRYLRLREKWSPGQRRAIYSGPFRRRVDVALAEGTYLRAPVTWAEGRSVDGAVRLDTLHGLPEDLLMKVDKMGMAHGVECRSPFLDLDWVEWVFRLEMEHLLRGGSGKDLLKRAAGGLLPRDLIFRRKQGFRVPMGRWLKGPLRGLVEEAFEPGRIRREEIFDPGAMAALRRELDQGPPSAALEGRVWQVVAFQTWRAGCSS